MNAFERNSFLSGNFAPTREELNYRCTNIEGKLPEDLNGHFLRVGPNPQFEPIDQAKYHWFDGDGMIHHMHFSEGALSYQNRWVSTKGFQLEHEAGKSIWKGFQSLHELEFHHGLMTKNVANTALLWHNNKLLALWEAGLPHSLTLPDLKTLGEEDFDGAWDSSFTAHPVICPESGDMITFGYNVVGEYGISYGVFDAKGRLKHKTQIKLKGKPVMIHDCAITENYTLMIDMPVTFSLERAMAGGAAFAWEPENGARVGILERFGKGEAIRWFDVENGFIFHVINAWEDGDEIILEACRSNCSSVISDNENENANQYSLEDEQAKPHQYRFNMKTGESRESVIDDLACEFPRINESLVGRKNQFAFASRFSRDSKAPRFDALVKFDRKNNEKEIFSFPEQTYSGEFVLAPKDNPESEDDVYLMGFVFDERKKQSELYIIDAKQFSRGPIARVIMPSAVPYGFHGIWVSKHEAAS